MSEIRNISDYKTMSDEELQSLYEKIRTGQQAPLSLGEVGIGGRLVSGFADTPQGKQKLLDRFGIEGSLRDPLGSGRADVFGAPSFSEGLNRFGDKLYEGARDAADLVGDVPAGIMGGLGAAAGFAAGAPAGPVASARLGIAGGGMGAAVGDMARQSIGGLAGSGESPNLGRTAFEGILGGLGAAIPGGGAKIAKKIAAPFADAANTAAIQEVRQGAEIFGIKSLPADALTEHEFVSGAAARSLGAATPHGDLLREGRNVLRGEQSDALERILKQGGPGSNLPIPSVDIYTEAGRKTLEARKEALGSIYDEARSVMGNTDFPVIVSETEAALGRMSKRTGVRDLPNQNITSGASQEIDNLIEDVANIRTYGQLNAFRRLIGDKLSNRQFLLEMKKAGHEVNFEDIYGALKRDLETSLPEGKLAQEFGGMSRGHLGETRRNELGVEVKSPDSGRFNASEMEAGRLGEGGLPTFPGRAGEVVRGRVPARPPAGEQRPSYELLDELSGRVDKSQALQNTADEGFRELMQMDNKNIIAIINDPTRAETIYSTLFRGNASPENLRLFKRYIGAEATPGGQAASEEGQAAFQQMLGQVSTDIRKAGEDVFAERLKDGVVPLDGKKLIARLDALGGEGVLSEGFGAGPVKDLYDFAHFLVQSSPTQRAFSAVGKSAGEETKITFFKISLARKIVESLTDKILKRGNFPLAGEMSTRLTTGLPRKEASSTMRALGAAAATPLGRIDTGPKRQ
jgi:hypothetical protein